jgi:hypothetical protein
VQEKETIGGQKFLWRFFFFFHMMPCTSEECASSIFNTEDGGNRFLWNISTIWHHILEDHDLQVHLKPHKNFFYF